MDKEFDEMAFKCAEYIIENKMRELERVQLCSSIMRARQNALNAVGLGDREKMLVFSIDGYEFPDLVPRKADSYDLNWLDIRVSFTDGSHHDEYIDACVLTWELDRIREGIDRLLKDEIDELDSDSMFLLTESTIYFTVRRAELGRYKVDINAKGHNVRTVISQDKLVHIRKQLALGQRIFPER